MQMGKKIIVTVSPEGETRVEAEGFTGTGCEDATRAIENALGTPERRDLKPEHNQVQLQTQKTGW